jgi:hypothetical protein
MRQAEPFKRPEGLILLVDYLGADRHRRMMRDVQMRR